MLAVAVSAPAHDDAAAPRGRNGGIGRFGRRRTAGDEALGSVDVGPDHGEVGAEVDVDRAVVRCEDRRVVGAHVVAVHIEGR